MPGRKRAENVPAEEPAAKVSKQDQPKQDQPKQEQQKKEKQQEKSAGGSSASASPSLKPKLPPADGKDKDEPAKPTMKKLVPWVHQELLKSLQADGTLRPTEALVDLRPLTIASTTASKSYKEHWVPEHST